MPIVNNFGFWVILLAKNNKVLKSGLFDWFLDHDLNTRLKSLLFIVMGFRWQGYSKTRLVKVRF